MALSDWKTKTRAFARVASTIVSQTDTGGQMDSQETAAILDAVKTYSVQRPRPLTAAGELASPAYELAVTDVIPDYSDDTHTIKRVWHPVDRQGQCQELPMDWTVYQKPDGTWWLKFLVWPPRGAFWVDYTQTHLLTLTDDTINDVASMDFEAICHLAASNILRMAANNYAPQYNTTIDVDSSNTSQQSFNYAMRAKDEQQKFEDHLAARPNPNGSGRVSWGHARPGHRDKFWNKRRTQ